MKREEKRTVLHMVEVETIGSTGEIERADESALISEKCAVDEVCRCAVLYRIT